LIAFSLVFLVIIVTNSKGPSYPARSTIGLCAA